MADWAIETLRPDEVPPKGLLQALLADEVAIVRVADVAPDIRPRALQAILEARPSVNAYSNAALTTVGPYLARHLGDPGPYFGRSGELDDLFIGEDLDPRPRLKRTLSALLGVEVARLKEADGRRYADGVVRLHADGVANPLHNDMIARDAKGSGLAVARSRQQLSSIYCLQECSFGGELAIFSKRWSTKDEKLKIGGGLGYHEEVVKDVKSVRFRPNAGDLYVIDPRNYHAIEPVVGQTRITLGSFLTFFDGDDNHAWAFA